MRKGTCERCDRHNVWINKLIMGPNSSFDIECCADCFEKYNVLKGRPKTGVSSGPNHNDPSFDNAVRILEGE